MKVAIHTTEPVFFLLLPAQACLSSILPGGVPSPHFPPLMGMGMPAFSVPQVGYPLPPGLPVAVALLNRHFQWVVGFGGDCWVSVHLIVTETQILLVGPLWANNPGKYNSFVFSVLRCIWPSLGVAQMAGSP